LHYEGTTGVVEAKLEEDFKNGFSISRLALARGQNWQRQLGWAAAARSLRHVIK
jgi:hypothetical protein